jgi:hypothetical protein
METRTGFGGARIAWLVASTVLGLVILQALLRLILSGINAANGDFLLTMDTLMHVDQSVALPAGWEVAGPLPVRITMTDPPLLQVLLVVGNQAAGFLLVVAVLWLIQRIAASMRRGDPFQEANARRLRWTGILLLFGYPLVVVLEGFFQNWFFSNEHSPPLPPGGLSIGFPIISMVAILGGLCVLVLAEVFRYGIRLRDDVEGMV